MEEIEKRKFKEFKKEVKKYKMINSTDLWMLIRRYTVGLPKRRKSIKWKEPAVYYKYWIKMLEGETLISKGNLIGVWDVKQSINWGLNNGTKNL